MIQPLYKMVSSIKIGLIVRDHTPVNCSYISEINNKMNYTCQVIMSKVHAHH
jgi:hypothetical protein